MPFLSRTISTLFRTATVIWIRMKMPTQFFLSPRHQLQAWALLRFQLGTSLSRRLVQVRTFSSSQNNDAWSEGYIWDLIQKLNAKASSKKTRSRTVDISANEFLASEEDSEGESAAYMNASEDGEGHRRTQLQRQIQNTVTKAKACPDYSPSEDEAQQNCRSTHALFQGCPDRDRRLRHANAGYSLSAFPNSSSHSQRSVAEIGACSPCW